MVTTNLWNNYYQVVVIKILCLGKAVDSDGFLFVAFILSYEDSSRADRC
jgi:hypothetical protein